MENLSVTMKMSVIDDDDARGSLEWQVALHAS